MAQPLCVLLCSRDRPTLRRLSQSLAAFGYEARQACGAADARAELQERRPQILLVDAAPDLGAALDLCRAAAPDDRPGPFIFLLIEKPSARAIVEALEAGVDDFLARPVVYGELLARLRAAARTVELDRRLRGEAVVDGPTGLASEAAFRRALADRADGAPASCVLIDLDRLEWINRSCGRAAGDAAMCGAAARLRDAVGEGHAAHFGAGRFAALLPCGEAEAAAWAVALGDAQRGAEPATEGPPRPTLSCGVAACERHAADEILVRAERALRAAKLSGRDCTMRFGECDDDSAAWCDLAAPGGLFSRSTARDVMTPCTHTLRLEDSSERAAALFARSSAAALPVVHADGTLAGLALPEDLPGDRDGAVARWMATDAPRFPETASFAELRDFFTEDPRPALAVVRGDVPVGVVTPDNLAALTATLTTATFAPPADSAALCVPDLRPLGAL